jgi:hypothetical protein
MSRTTIANDLRGQLPEHFLSPDTSLMAAHRHSSTEEQTSAPQWSIYHFISLFPHEVLCRPFRFVRWKRRC